MNIDDKIIDASKSILNYCLAKTSNSRDAEDLAQDIIYELVKSVKNLRNENAFYGFMWGVADNVYKQWYRKKMKSPVPDELDDNLRIDDIIDDESDIYILRRELSLLSEKYRKAVILYYINNKSCTETSQILNISESMVKYLLFKSRKILKEGIIMDRNYGEQSYNPKNLSASYWGYGPNHFTDIVDHNKIVQNILWACYNDSLTDSEISLQIGVTLPYIEEHLDKLISSKLLIKNGNKYSTNIIIISNDFHNEVLLKINGNLEEYSDLINQNIDLSDNIYKWQMIIKIVSEVYSNIMNNHNLYENMPVTAFGEQAYIYGVEQWHSSLNSCNVGNDLGEIHFRDWTRNPKGHHNDFYGKKEKINLILDIVLNNKSTFNEYEEEYIADMIKQGYLIKENDKLITTIPIYTKTHFDELIKKFNPLINQAKPIIENILNTMSNILKNHIPSHLKKQADVMVYITSYSYIVGEVINKMINKNYIHTNWDVNDMPTTYIISK